VAFGQPNLQLFFTNRFLSDYALNFFIHGKQHIGKTIFDNQMLGVHTDVFWFKEGKKARFFWGHPLTHPHGNPAPPMCDQCHCLLPWKVDEGAAGKWKRGKNEMAPITHVCEGCCKPLEYKLPEDASWVRNHHYGELDQGAWFVVQEGKLDS
jgi:hypothetical protein